MKHVINFKHEFKPLILSGSKTTTIRKPRARRILPGDTLNLYTGLRTKKAELIKSVDCTSCVPISISCSPNLISGCVYIERAGKWIEQYPSEVKSLATKDGFNSVKDFLNFFRDCYGEKFEGDFISWG